MKHYSAVLWLTGIGAMPLLASLKPGSKSAKPGSKSAVFRKASQRLGVILTATNCSTAAFTFRGADSGRPDHFMSDPQWMR